VGLSSIYTWTFDTVAPTASITGKPSDPSNSASPSFTFTASQAGSTFACRLDAAAFVSCTSPKSYAGLADGSHTFAVEATDPAGNTSTQTSYTWTVDTVAPTASITGKPSDPSNSTAPGFTFTASQAGSTFLCKLDAAAFAACTSPKSYTGLAEGSHTFVVRATDQAGNPGVDATYTWTVDTAAPTATITQKPVDPSNSTAPSFTFTASQAGGTFLCKLDTAAFAACTSPKGYTGLADGSHTFTVRAVDPAGNTSADASSTWTIDTAPPTTAITVKPTDPSSVVAPSFSFTPSEGGSTIACKLDAAAFAACSSPKSYAGLAQGAHTFTVRSTDLAGNAGPETSYTWTIDTAAPTTTLSSKPTDPTSASSASFVFSASETSAFACRLDGVNFAACTSPTSYTALGDGAHTFAVRATDPAGNVGPTVTYTWMIDTTAPTATITDKPGLSSNDTSPSFSFSTTEAGSSFSCKLDSQAFASCVSPKSYGSLAEGSHTWRVRASDGLGNVGPEAVYTWTIDTTPPTATITQKPKQASNVASPSFSFTSSESGSTFACRIEQGGFAPCTSPKTYGALVDGEHTFSVRASDAAGNTGSAVVYIWTIDTVAPTTTITAKPTHPSNNSAPSFTFTAGDIGSTIECKLDGAPFAACTSPTTYTGVADGPHTFAARATDPAGNTGPQAAYSWTIETRGPTVGLTSAPGGLSNSSVATFSFSADEPSSFDCKLDGRGFEACNSPASYHGLGDGPHSLSVRAQDAVGNFSVAVTHTWRIDTTAPETTLAAKPKLMTSSAGAGFSFNASEAGTFECRLDGSPFVLCASPKGYGSLRKGAHRFEVRAIDLAGNADATPALYGWTIKAPTRATSAASALLAPRIGARVTQPPLLRWKRVAKARYYNVQLFRGRVKIFTAWPTRSRLRLPARWKFQGRERRLKPGAYQWYVWPGYGPPSARRYGSMLGQSSFTVARPPARR
jgi:hypothetical protein